MATQTVPIHRTNGTTKNTDNKSDISFNPFDYAPGQDGHIRWLSRPNQQLIRNKYAHDIEKFRITFDVENFQPEQIKVNDIVMILVILFLIIFELCLDLYSKS